jgi:site-specific DNA-methyltransferase (adenine-specific)
MQDAFGRVSIARQGLGDIRKLQSVSRRGELKFDPIDEIRDAVAKAICEATDGWAILFCIAEGVQAWRDALQAAGARYKRAMVWTKPDAMPQFNGQGPSIGHEMMVSAWCGPGHSRWNGGGRAGNFEHCKDRNRVHDTQKPIALMNELVALFTSPGDIVLDPFMGSGTTGVSCLMGGRGFIGVEKNEAIFDIACRRMEEAYAQPQLPFVEKKPLQRRGIA